MVQKFETETGFCIGLGDNRGVTPGDVNVYSRKTRSLVPDLMRVLGMLNTEDDCCWPREIKDGYHRATFYAARCQTLEFRELHVGDV